MVLIGFTFAIVREGRSRSRTTAWGCRRLELITVLIPFPITEGIQVEIVPRIAAGSASRHRNRDNALARLAAEFLAGKIVFDLICLSALRTVCRDGHCR